MTKYYEKNCDIFAQQLWKKAYPEADHHSIVNQVFTKVEGHIQSLPYLDQNEHYHSTYTYKRLEVN